MKDYNERLQQMAKDRAARVQKLRDKGMRWKEICELEGCTRQRLWALLRRFETGSAPQA